MNIKDGLWEKGGLSLQEYWNIIGLMKAGKYKLFRKVNLHKDGNG